MNNYITVKEIEDSIDFINLAFTLKNIDAKSRDDISKVCKEQNFNINNLTSNIQIHSDIVNTVDSSNISDKYEGDALITNIK